jgi:DNA-directed RNA polymerase subunit RPC12/RpoP
MRVERNKLEVVIKSLRELYSKQKFKCVSCGKELPFIIEDAWKPSKTEAWLYIECRKCQYQNAIWKIIYNQFPEVFEQLYPKNP